MTINHVGNHAVVIGSSLAGLMVARVLSDHFTEVTVIERDSLPDDPDAHNNGVHPRYAHTLLTRGRQILEELFPGLTDDLIAAGAGVSDSGADVIWHQHGTLKSRVDTGLPLLSMSQPLLESTVRTYLQKQANVRLMTGYRVIGLVADESAATVTGVRITHVDRPGAAMRMEADLVVEPGGGGNRAPEWLKALGYPEVPVNEVTVNQACATALFRIPPGARDWNMLLLMAPAPSTRIGTLFPVEGNRWLVITQAMFGDAPPTDDEGFLSFLRSLSLPHLYDAIKGAERIGKIMPSRTPSSIRYRYEKMSRFPDGFVVLGDAVCNLKPRYGQGVTVLALGVETLSQCLQEQASRGRDSLAGFSRRFQRQVARAVDLPWKAFTRDDLAYPGAEGERPALMNLVNWYMPRVSRLAAQDPDALRAYLSVVHMLKPTRELFRPGLVWKALTTRTDDPYEGTGSYRPTLD